MSPNSLVFSHQRETVIELARSFESIKVFTTETSSHPLPENITVVTIPWRRNFKLLNLLGIIGATFPVLMKNRNAILFSYMTDVHAAIIAPLAWLLRMRHVLWYAHASNSPYLIWSSFFLSRIVSSTPGSCNLGVNQEKIVFINQGIKQNDFPFESKTYQRLSRLLYYGRLDVSKNIHLFNDLMLALNREERLYSLEVFGKPASSASELYFRNLKASSGLSQEIRFNGPIARKSLSGLSGRFDIFVNLFTGSLDKTLIESTFMGLPVVTWNQEYCSEFGTWSGEPATESLEFITREILFLSSMEEGAIRKETLKRLSVALKNHSFDGWVSRLVSVLKEGVEE